MAHYSFHQHAELMQAYGVTPDPRLGDGSPGAPFRAPDGSRPRRSLARERAAIARYRSLEPAGFDARARAIAASLPPMRPECRLSVLLPCRNEAQHVERMLDLLAGQRDGLGRPLDPAHYEILLLCNGVAGEPRDDTAALARDWARRYAGAGPPTHVIDYTHPEGEPPLTMARKLLADIALQRGAARTEQAGPLYLACEDCDILWLDPLQLWLMITRLDAEPGLDALRGQQDRCPWIMLDYLPLLIMRRSWNFLETYFARRSLRPDRNPRADFNWNRFVTSGWNTAFTAEVYAAIGGYTWHRPFEEDMDIGEKISVLRSFEAGGRRVAQVNTTGWIPTRSEGSPRRWLYRLSSGIEPYLDRDDYDNFFNARHERVVKFSSLEELAAGYADGLERAPASLALLSEMLSKDLAVAAQVLGDAIRARAVYARVLSALGFRPGEASLLPEPEMTDAGQAGGVRIAALAGPAARRDALRARYRGAPADPLAALRSGRRRSCWAGLTRDAEALREGGAVA